ncbi:hypothetical protein CONPUDRAFT_154151 [Coniophora puteana RWD-64-598 SS2]|uniref:Uncharacterized protein n=1 Tax=Coniophora puteana (strain RWD-64-598) TaxID=741705 RepID=A0A5M3MRB7_CONPW|nr:uncharacterized protein CONPUDRAFT_154151 [Coniophora puteana RWD-64-598 SS2]EIW81620.1 hypothetical protein CONPUDRAFT_154151 [Coniophora puteana RWD-64-598 SS2]
MCSSDTEDQFHDASSVGPSESVTEHSDSDDATPQPPAAAKEKNPAYKQLQRAPDDPLYFTETLTRHWATGRIKELLDSHIEGYRAARGQSTTRARDYIDTVTNEYFALVPWRNKVSDPIPDKSPDAVEDLTEIEAAQKAAKIKSMKATIKGWYDNRVKSIRSAGRPGNKENDVWTRLLKQLAGVSQTKPKRLSPSQRWSKDHYSGAVKVDFEARWALKKNELGDNHRAQFRESVTSEHFARLSLAEQAVWATKASDEHKIELTNWQTALKAPIDTSPEGRQCAIDNLPGFIGPILEGIREYTGLQASFFGGGPEPRKGGRLNIITTHEGGNLAATPLNWQASNPAAFKVVQKLYLTYLKTCYTPATMAACALKNSKEVVSEAMLAKLLSMDGDEGLGPDIASGSSTSPSESSSSRPAHASPLPPVSTPKPHPPRSSTPIPPSDLPPNAIATIADTTPKRDSPPAGRATAADRKAKRKVSSITSEEASDSKATETNDDGDTTPRPVKRPYNTRLRDEPEASTIANAPRAASEAPTETLSDKAIPIRLPNNRRRGLARPAAATTELVASSDKTSQFVVGDKPDPRTGVDASAKVHLSNLDLADGAPQWFCKALDYLRAADSLPSADRQKVSQGKKSEISDRQGWTLPLAYTHLLEEYLVLEKSSDFSHGKGSATALETQHRPDQIATWIKNGRASSCRPTLRDPQQFAKGWWAWWAHIQPQWRHIAAPSDSVAPRLSREDGDWSAFDKPGQNGFLSVIVALKWWGSETSESSKDPLWEAAAEDVRWVMGCVAQSRSPAEQSIVPRGASGSVPKKRRRQA